METEVVQYNKWETYKPNKIITFQNSLVPSVMPYFTVVILDVYGLHFAFLIQAGISIVELMDTLTKQIALFTPELLKYSSFIQDMLIAIRGMYEKLLIYEYSNCYYNILNKNGKTGVILSQILL